MLRVLHFGVDLRVPADTTGDAWDADRRARYLLRRDVVHPLSVDPAVWPRVDAPAPLLVPWVGIEAIRALAIPSPHELVVLGGVVVTPADAARMQARGCTDLDIDPGWQLLGYDVVEAGGTISGLSNCGYGEEADTLRERWAAELDAQSGLFTDPTSAAAFRAETDARVPEHAPFEVVAIWRAR